jgi:hypothetical protein
MAKSQRDVLTAAVHLICRAYQFAAIMLSLSVGMRATQSSGPNNMEEPQSRVASPTAPATKPKNIWTNDDQSGSSVSRGATARSARSSPGAAVFLTPHDGDVVQPGEVLQIEISVTPGKVKGPVAIVSAIGVSNEVRESPPYSFTMNVARGAHVGAGSPLIGKHAITAFGKLSGQNDYALASIDLDVEEHQMPTKLSVAGNLQGSFRQVASFYAAGEQESIEIYAKFPNGDEFDVINSTHLKLVSGNPHVVNIGEEGMLTSIGPGSTFVSATYTFGGQTLEVSLPVSVTVPTGGLIPTPLSLDFGDQPAGRESNPLRVVLTNRSNSTIKIYKPEIRAAARESDDCTAAPLSPGRSCSMSVTFFPIRPGRSQGVIYIPNSQSGQISLPVSGNGI